VRKWRNLGVEKWRYDGASGESLGVELSLGSLESLDSLDSLGRL
jgi:hypothetical protein